MYCHHPDNTNSLAPGTQDTGASVLLITYSQYTTLCLSVRHPLALDEHAFACLSPVVFHDEPSLHAFLVSITHKNYNKVYKSVQNTVNVSPRVGFEISRSAFAQYSRLILCSRGATVGSSISYLQDGILMSRLTLIFPLSISLGSFSIPGPATAVLDPRSALRPESWT